MRTSCAIVCVAWLVSCPAANQAPVANAGADGVGEVGVAFPLDGRASSDADGDALSFTWTLTAQPAGSTATLLAATTAQPTLTPDVEGAYDLSLVVNDGALDSTPDAVRVTASQPDLPPLAVIEVSGEPKSGGSVTLDGDGSSDPENGALTFAWTIVQRPADSLATLENPAEAAVSLHFDVAGTYVVQLEVTDSAGHVATAEETLVAVAVWQPGAVIDGDAFATRLVHDEAGAIVTVHRRARTGGGMDVVVRRSVVGDPSWATEEIVGTPSSEIDVPLVAVGPNGHVAVTWYELDTDHAEVRVARFDPVAQAWAPPESAVTIASSELSGPWVSVNGSGVVFASWDARDLGSSGRRAYANRFVPGVGWGEPTRLADGGPSAVHARVAVNEAGGAIAVFVEGGDGQPYALRAASYLPGTGWSAAATIDGETGIEHDSYLPHLAMDGAGHAWVAWPFQSRGESSMNRTFVARRDASTGVWGPPQEIGNPSRQGSQPAIAVNRAGDVAVAWGEYDSEFTNKSIYARIRAAGSETWSSAAPIESTAGNSTDPGVTLDASGNALVGWYQWNGSAFDVNARQWSASSSAWGVLSRVGGVSGINSFEYDLVQPALGVAGRATMTWMEGYSFVAAVLR